MINPLAVASHGLLPGDPLCIATLGFICPEVEVEAEDLSYKRGRLRGPPRSTRIFWQDWQDEEEIAIILAVLAKEKLI